MSPSSATLASGQRQKAPTANGALVRGNGVMLRKMTTRMKQLQEELALESVTNIEFEESSRKSFEFLTGQVKTLKEAFNTLTDTFLQELEHLSGAISGEFLRLEEGVVKDVADSMSKSDEMEKHIEQQEKHTEQLGKDLDAVLSVIPKIEDSMLRTNHHVQDRLEQVSGDVTRSSSAMQLLEEKVNRVESDLREELEQRLLKQQRNITRQLESMSRVLMTDEDRRVDQNKTSQSFGSGMGGGTFQGNNSPWRERERERDRAPSNLDRDRERDRDQRPSSPWADRIRETRDSARGDRDSASARGDRDSARDVPRLAVTSHREPAPPSPWHDRGPSDGNSERDRGTDRAWSDRGSTKESSLRLPVESRRPGDYSSSYRGPTLDSYRERLSSVHDSPRQSSRRGGSPESLAAPASVPGSVRTSERLWQDPRQSRKDSKESEPAPVSASAPKPGHIQVDFDLSGLQGASPTNAGPRPRSPR